MKKWVPPISDAPLPRYKRGKEVRTSQVRAALDSIRSRLVRLEIPESAVADDDHLDAWIAWRMGVGFLNGETGMDRLTRDGGYVVPITGSRPSR